MAKYLCGSLFSRGHFVILDHSRPKKHRNKVRLANRRPPMMSALLENWNAVEKHIEKLVSSPKALAFFATVSSDLLPFWFCSQGSQRGKQKLTASSYFRDPYLRPPTRAHEVPISFVAPYGGYCLSAFFGTSRVKFIRNTSLAHNGEIDVHGQCYAATFTDISLCRYAIGRRS